MIYLKVRFPLFPILIICFLNISCEQSQRNTLQEVPALPETAPPSFVQTPPPAEDIPGSPGEMITLTLELPQPRFIGTPRTALIGDMDTQPIGFPRPPFYVPAGTENLALHRPVTSSDSTPLIGALDLITDGDKEAQEGSYVELGPFLQQVTIDLELSAEIYALALWHCHQYPAVYNDVIIQVAENATFSRSVHTIYNNDQDNSSGFGVGTDPPYIETYEGKLINAGGVRGRYVRLYSRGNNCSDLNHYTEVEVYGLPVPTL